MSLFIAFCTAFFIMDMCWLLNQKQVKMYIFMLVFLVLPGPVRILQGM